MNPDPGPAGNRADIRLAVLAVWWIVSAALLAAAAVPLLVPQDTIGRLIPPCEWQARHGRPCPLCGLTTGFYHIAGGQWREAGRANGASLPLYILFWANGVAALAVLLSRPSGWQPAATRRAKSRRFYLED